MSGWTVLRVPRSCGLGVVALTVAALAVAPPATAGADDAPIPAVCAEPSTPDPIETVAEAASLLEATWIRCDGDRPWFAGAAGDHLGLEFTADGAFFRVYQDTDGSLIRAEGMLQEGRWEIQGVHESGAMLVLTLMGSGTMAGEATFHDGASFLRTMGEDGVTRDYARWAGARPEPGPPVGVDEGPCGPLTTPMTFDDVEAAERAVVGIWTRCVGSAVFGVDGGDDVGLELTAAGRFFRLHEAADGSLVRAGGLRQEGMWVVNEPNVADPSRPWSSIDFGLRLAGSGYFPIGVTVHDDGDMLRFTDSMDGTGSVYVRWSGSAPVPGLPVGVGEGPCGHPIDLVELSSSDQLEHLLIGTWTVCDGEPFGAGVVGAEFAADGSFRALVRAADGTVVVDEGSVGATWTLWPFDEPFDAHNGPQIDVTYADGGTRTLQPDVFASPLFMSLWPDWGVLAGAPPDLPRTGRAAPWNVLVVGGVLVAAGSLLVGSARRTGGGHRR